MLSHFLARVSYDGVSSNFTSTLWCVFSLSSIRTIYSAQRNLHYPQRLHGWREKIMFFITACSKFFTWLIPPKSIHFPLSNIPHLHPPPTPILSVLGCSTSTLSIKFQDEFRFLPVVQIKWRGIKCWGRMQWHTQEFFSVGGGGGFNKFSWGQRTERGSGVR